MRYRTQEASTVAWILVDKLVRRFGVSLKLYLDQSKSVDGISGTLPLAELLAKQENLMN